MIHLEAALAGGILAALPGPATILFLSRYAAKGWNSRAIVIHLEHDARVVGRTALGIPASGAPSHFKARGRVTI